MAANTSYSVLINFKSCLSKYYEWFYFYLYNKSGPFPCTIPGFEGGFRGGWGPWPAGVGRGTGLLRLVTMRCSPLGRGAVVEGAMTPVTFGGEGAVR